MSVKMRTTCTWTERGGRSDQARATVYQKHRSPQSRKTMYGG
uniref:Uncharacterized protein n=1 Tax=Rhizophora mucronata TaxID=61149 RepID=A0A2P2LZJ9_RHIMU